MMNDQEEIDLEFYKNGLAESVLKRYEFSDEEKELIHSAIRTAKMKHPRMQVVEEADALLKEVAKSREVIYHEPIDQESAAKAMALTTAPYFSRHRLPFWVWFLLILLIIATSNIYYMAKDRFSEYSFQEAKAYCHSKDKVLPKDIEALRSSGFEMHQDTQLWAADGTVLESLKGNIPRTKERYPVRCVTP